MSQQESLTQMFKKMSDMIEVLVEENEKLKEKNTELEKKWEEHTDSIVETYFANTGCADITHKELEKLKEKNAELEKKNGELDMVEDLFNKYCSIIDENADAWEDWVSESECYKRNEDGEIVEIDEDQ
jgi:FtsZ-binding cell division protein ZapB